MKPEEFITRYASLAFQAQEETGIDYRVILAQWALETGWGENDLSRHHNNLGSIKYTGKYGTPGPNGFASYSDLNEFLEDYIRVMNLDYYARVRSAQDPEAQIRALQASPYDENHYPGLPELYRKYFASL